MSNTLLEVLRVKQEEIEILEKALSKAIGYKEANPKEVVTADWVIKKLIDEIKQKSKEVIDIYSDSDGSRKEEIDILAGNKNVNQQDIGRTPDIWNNYYEKVREIKVLNKNLNSSSELIENITPEKIFNFVFEQVTTKSVFLAEENKGKCVDLHELFTTFQNLKKLKELKSIDSDDYLSFLSDFDNFDNIPIHIKKNIHYKDYIRSILNYLKQFYEKSHPLMNTKQVIDTILTQFETEWEQGTLQGWEEILKNLRNDGDENDGLYCINCKKRYANEQVFEHHKSGKHHQKAVAKMANQVEVNAVKIRLIRVIKEINPKEEKECKEIAIVEYQIEKLAQLLYDQIENTKNQIRKKQSRNYHEMEIEILDSKVVDAEASDSDEEKPIYNPKNVPLGWDGKPIPYWLYKLHGLGIEYKCEICGGASYWGRRAYERHFQEWRHSYGMKCLKIPNTVHFKDVTNIEEALRLYQKLQDDKVNMNFKPEAEEEFEDSDGNIVSKKMYLDLKRQGYL